MKKIISLAIALLSLSIFCLSPFAEGTQSAMGILLAVFMESIYRAVGNQGHLVSVGFWLSVMVVLTICLHTDGEISTMWIREKQLSATVPAPSVQSAIS